MISKIRCWRVDGLIPAIGMSLAFLCMSFVRLVGDTQSMAFSNIVLDTVFSGPIWGTALARNISSFALALIVLHVCLGVFAWLLAALSQYSFPNVSASRSKWTILWCSALLLWILIANAALYPYSSLGEPYAKLAGTGDFGIDVFRSASIAVTLAIASVVLLSAKKWLQTHRAPVLFGAIVIVIALTVTVATWASRSSTHVPDKPHVIIIGIDSLRYDATEKGARQAQAPNIQRFLAGSAAFSDATTPLARTFPSWVSILTGRHPHTTGAIINLLPRELIRTGPTLGDMLRRQRYRTIYGIDEVRFSNLDASYGFDEVIAPAIGASDFVIGWFGDTPLSNLVMNSRVGAALFPYIYANRAAAVTYKPDVFIDRLNRKLDFSQPTFLAVHFTLVHWPFHWADSPQLAEDSTDDEKYAMAVRRVDQQFQDLLSLLERKGALENALVIVLSDHGESLGLPEDSLVSSTGSVDELLERNRLIRGHGTSVLSVPQYHVVLGMRSFGAFSHRFPAPQLIDAPVSVEDIAPTVAELLALSTTSAFDGRSLVPLLSLAPDGKEPFNARIRFTETEFNPPGVNTFNEVPASAIAAAAAFYRVDPITDRIEVRTELIPELLKSREYAAFSSRQLVAALPRPSGNGFEFIVASRNGSESAVAKLEDSANTADTEISRLRSAIIERFGLPEN